ncbi:nitroreductase family protein [Taylorella equigenitalis]|uniref:nitroreductase family protein n=1 Tax=Taylorella equigenitalis TaxID=29575 RepID=UPI00041F575F|nr:nitroreductase family protein [Taylorella equigenitalis]WDU47049.1 nitroreductase family protein [Taylorella equigenitalis]
MNFLEIAQTRYTTKVYDPTKKVSDSDIETLKEILRLTPSSINSQPWHFTFISNEEIKKELSPRSYHNDQKVLDCSHVLVMSVYKNIEDLESKMPEYLWPTAIEYYEKRGKPRGKQLLELWMASQAYIALGFILPAIASLGIDSTAIEGIEHEAYKVILDKHLGTDKFVPVVAVLLGYRAENDFNQLSLKPKSRLPLEQIITELK